MLPRAELSPVVFLVVFDVEGLPPSACRYVSAEHRLLRLREVEREAFTAEFLLQAEHGSGSAILFLVAPLSSWLRHFGDRGYRAANFQIGFLSDRLYLLAETLGLTYSSSGGFAPASVDELFGLDGYHFTTLFSFVIGGPRA
jgi:SagB-type dehydrogenase family enzyme